ncbi:MAG: hypothetical protein JXB49_09250 [Bacteroidales bacterium]|nr:hypothetical protein [Bacteroidales bacterium]
MANSNTVRKNPLILKKDKILSNLTKREVLQDYYIAYLSRQLSILARKEVHGGKAKFGIFGDGKEIAQIAYAKQFKVGDWRSGYYRDQTFMMAAGLLSAEQFFALLYGDSDLSRNPFNGGRSFNNHFATRSLDEMGNWKDITRIKNSSSDISPTAGQMPRLLGLAYASKLIKLNQDHFTRAGIKATGNEVAFGMIGEGSTTEGHFFETINAAGVLQVPVAVAIWDDGYGISVPVKYQTTKQSISDALKGFEKKDEQDGILIYKGQGWDYIGLVNMFEEGIFQCRTNHIPVLFHITELTQPSGHSTSGSHERYKTKERLDWEAEYDALKKMRQWIIDTSIALENELENIEEKALDEAIEAKNNAWKEYITPLIEKRDKLIKIVENRSCICTISKENMLNAITDELKKNNYPIRRDLVSAARKMIRHICLDCDMQISLKGQLKQWLKDNLAETWSIYSNLLYNESDRSALKIEAVSPKYSNDSRLVNGREVLQANFDYLFNKYPKLVTFGEDTGRIGDVNGGLSGLQERYGEFRVSDTGIRETTIIGQGIGLALRGLRPIAEIQYLDYILYALQTLSDDLATLHWRTAGGQSAPLIIRTRGHRLEGIWHSGSPMSMILGSLRGIFLCVPRNMTQAAGFYNTLLRSEDPAIVIEPLNGYQLKEEMPLNIGEFFVPLGTPEVLKEGEDITLVTYGSCVNIAMEAAKQLADFDISVEIIDAQTLLPFDIHHNIVDSIKKTNRVMFFDEDVPGGGTAYMMQQVLEEQKAYMYLDSAPVTLSGAEHRPAYSSDGDYFSNPNAENVFEKIYGIMHESNPKKYPELY